MMSLEEPVILLPASDAHGDGLLRCLSVSNRVVVIEVAMLFALGAHDF